MNNINEDTFHPGKLQFNQTGAVITIENNNSMIVTNTLNISQGSAQFWNKGSLSVGQNYNSSSTSVYVNYGTFTGRFNLNNGGKLIISGTFTSGQIDFGNSNSRVENYGYFKSSNTSGAITVLNPIILTLTDNVGSTACPNLMNSFSPDNSNYYSGN